MKCAACGSSLNVSYDKKRGRYTGFTCWVYKNYGKGRCTSHAIGYMMASTNKFLRIYYAAVKQYLASLKA